ncbi:XRE family transcriptional regulator [Streptomyces sp. SAS_270]|uniref:XRE family transcriptional regulator n=1 Tax=Streptomyces sp. SAS_270 TaxID=3412748 RepID=UPI00403D49EE
MEGNEILKARMAEAGYTQAELADEINAVLLAGGHRGTVSDRTVRNWLTGTSSWPHRRQRAALETVFLCQPEELGFSPPANAGSNSVEDANSVHRRTFIAVTAKAAIAAGTPAGVRPGVGLSDVQKLRGKLADLWRADDQSGGSTTLEHRALKLAQQTLHIQRHGSATQCIRSRLYALAASFTAMAMWAAVDSRRLADAQRHLESAVTLAGLSGDAQVQHQTWRYAAMLAEQRGRYIDAIAASEAAMATGVHRSDPLYASLSHTSLALGSALAGDSVRALRALDRAASSFDRADLVLPRPASMSFYTEGELHGLTGITWYRIGQADRAEFHAHRCLSALRPGQHRNRVYYTVQLALAQLGQEDVDLASHTAADVWELADASGGRVPYLLRKFTAALNMHAPDAAATTDWNERIRTA